MLCFLRQQYGLQVTQLQCLNAGIADQVNFGELKFKRYPENLLNSRARYGKAFQVCHAGSTELLICTVLQCIHGRLQDVDSMFVVCVCLHCSNSTLQLHLVQQHALQNLCTDLHSAVLCAGASRRGRR